MGGVGGALIQTSELSSFPRRRPLPPKMRNRLKKKKRGRSSPRALKGTAAISYLWPECVIRAKMSRRLSGTVALANSARSAGLHLLIVVLIAVAHLSMPSALGYVMTTQRSDGTEVFTYCSSTP